MRRRGPKRVWLGAIAPAMKSMLAAGFLPFRRRHAAFVTSAKIACDDAMWGGAAQSDRVA
jgi:hypothetical protein